MTAAAIEPTEGFLRWRYLAWSLAALAAMIAAIVAGNLWLLDFVHVLASLLWTGIDLFMGFVLGPILRRVPLAVRREIMRGNSRSCIREYQASAPSAGAAWL